MPRWGPCKGQLNIKREMLNISILKQIFIFFSSFETDLMKENEKKNQK